MDFDALTGGVEPGGLRVKNDIRLLICYLLSSINAPLSKQDIVQIMQENSLANYFEVMDSLSEMIQKGTIDTVSFNQLNEKEDCVICNDITCNIAKQLDSTLPISVRDCAVSAAFKLLAKAKREKELKTKKKQLKQLKAALEAAPENPYLASEIEKIKAQIKKLSEPFKYVYVIELQEYKRGTYAGCSNWHFHLFVTGGLTSREIESMWKAGQRINCNNFQPERFGAETAARYMMKDPQGKRRFACSRNLDKPITPPPKDGKVSRRTVERMATVYANDAEYWERKYKGYKFVRCFSRFNAYNEHWYVSVVMYKTNKAMPEWTMSDWVQPL